MKRGAAAVIGAALLVAAWGVAAVTPSDDDVVAPFPVSAQIGDEAVGRVIAVTIQDVRRAETVSAGDWGAEGNWVVVDLDAEGVVSEGDAALNLATLEVDGATYRASERPDSLFAESLSVGIPRSGSVAFELPASVRDGAAILRLGARIDTRLDSVIVLEVDLGSIDVDPGAELIATGWSAG